MFDGYTNILQSFKNSKEELMLLHANQLLPFLKMVFNDKQRDVSVTRAAIAFMSALADKLGPSLKILFKDLPVYAYFLMECLESDDDQIKEAASRTLDRIEQKMPGITTEDVKDQELANSNPEVQGEAKLAENLDIEHPVENPVPSVQEEEAVIKNKYGGMLPRKPQPPLISKDHERAFFDSADWAFGKQGAPVGKPKGPLEALRPKLQPSHNQSRSRRSAYAPADNEEDGGNNSGNSED